MARFTKLEPRSSNGDREDPLLRAVRTSTAGASLRREGGIKTFRSSGKVFLIWSGSRVQFTWARFERLASERAGGPVRLATVSDRHLWWSESGFWSEDAGLDADAVGLLLWDKERRAQSRLARLAKLREKSNQAQTMQSSRELIPEDVRAFVWSRDNGSCVRCGAESDLQFDHIIPVAKGGGNSYQNVQVLCGDCNRLKGDSII